jgi:replicative DNA helicase
MTNYKRKKETIQAEIVYNQTQPQILDLEEAVLGALLLENGIFDTIAKDFSPNLFYKEANNIVATTIEEMYRANETIDILTVSQKLKANGTLDKVGGAFYVSSLTNRISSTANVEYHVKLLQQYTLKRSLIKICGNAVQRAYSENDDVFDAYSEVQISIDDSLKQVLNYDVANIREIHLQGLAESREVANGEGISGVETGLVMVDNLTSGWQKSDLIIIAGRPAMGKCLSIGSLVYTNSGFIKIGEAKIGQKILGSNGLIGKITGVFPQGKKDVFRVYFDDNTFVDCCNEHLWEVSTRTDRKASYGNKEMRTSVLKTNQMIGNLFCSDGRSNYSIKIIKPLNFEHKEITLNPYLLGFYLGGGYSSKSIVCFSNIEKYLVLKVELLLSDTDKLIQLNYKDYKVRGINKKKSNIWNDLYNLDLIQKKSDKKFIPKNYLYNTIEVRTLLLQGLVDTDGYIPTKGRSAIEYSTVSIQLRDDILELVRGLGGKASYLVKKGSYTKNGVKHEAKEYYRMYLSLPPEIIPISSKKHTEKYSQEKKFHRKFITKIEELGIKEEMVCISVNTPDSLFITDGYNLTHNTSVVLSMVINASVRKGTPVAIFSLEMSKQQLGGRIQADLSGVDVGKIIKKQLDLGDIDYIEKNCEKLLTAPLFIDDTPNISIIELKSKARRLVKEKGVKLIAIDYLQLMRSGLGIMNREQEIAEISRSLKGLAKELDIPIIALSQLSRLVEGRSDKKPQLSDLRESGQIEQDADMVAFCYRPEYYGVENYEIDGDTIDAKGLFMLIIAKHRNGELGEVPLRFIHSLAKITNHPRWVSQQEEREAGVQPMPTENGGGFGQIAQNEDFLKQTNNEGFLSQGKSAYQEEEIKDENDNLPF